MEPKKIKNPTGMLIMHGTVIAVVLYMAWQLVRSYRAGGAEAPSLTTLIVGLVLLVGGCVVVGWLAVRLFLQAKRSALLRITAERFLVGRGDSHGLEDRDL